MSSIALADVAEVSPAERLEVLFEELAELTGQRIAIDGRIVEIVAEIDHGHLWGATGCRSISALVAWRTGVSPGNAATIAAVAHRLPEFPRCAEGMREGRLSLDQVGVVADRAADGSDEHFARLARYASVSQLRTAVKLEPRPEPDRPSEPMRSITRTGDEQSRCWRIKLGHLEAAKFDAALRSHLDALLAEWKSDHGKVDGEDAGSEQRPPLRSTIDAFLRPVEVGWDALAARRPHGQHASVVVHLDVEKRAGPPTQPPPSVPPCTGPAVERAQWWWYEPFQPQPRPTTNWVDAKHVGTNAKSVA